MQAVCSCKPQGIKLYSKIAVAELMPKILLYLWTAMKRQGVFRELGPRMRRILLYSQWA